MGSWGTGVSGTFKGELFGERVKERERDRRAMYKTTK
jgi:hypothetical protein